MGILDDDDLTPPEPSDADAAHAAVSALLDSVPVLGSFAVEIFAWFLAPPLERRRQEWMEDVAETLRLLWSERGIRPEKLRENPDFVDAVLAATQAAIRTSRAEKRLALRNAVANAGLPGAPEHAIQQMFIGAVDRLTATHLGILKRLQLTRGQHVSRRRPNTPTPGSPPTVDASLSHVFDPFNGPTDFLDVVWSDLRSFGFYTVGEPGTVSGPDGPKRLTPLGEQFLAFIEDPL